MPFQIVSGGSVYASNQLEAYSSPAPASCQISTQLWYGGGILSSGLLESEYSRYKACSALLNKPINTDAYPCVVGPSLTQFYTHGETDLITPDGTEASDSQDSSSIGLYCAA